MITVCDRAAQSCPTLPAVAERFHWSIRDPAEAEGDHEQRMAAFRAARDDLDGRIRALLEGL